MVYALAGLLMSGSEDLRADLISPAGLISPPKELARESKPICYVRQLNVRITRGFTTGTRSRGRTQCERKIELE
jgi:hypothetical protein